jgi:hypothetical protein
VPPTALARLVRHLADPLVGLVGPVSNDAATEAEVDGDYRTYGGLLAAAAERACSERDLLLEVPMLTMFCVALRREVFDTVGPLDEGFGIGLFEDDDYALRVRQAGLRVVCAEGVLVHHFGEASFGRLVPTGEYMALFQVNRGRFEAKWGVSWERHGRRRSEQYERLVDRIRVRVDGVVPAGARVLVVSRGDDELLELDGRHGAHFPQLEGGVFAGFYPADSDEAIAQLERARQAGADYLLFPRTSLWWLDHYAEFAAHLRRRYAEVAGDDDCLIFALEPSGVHTDPQLQASAGGA